MTDNVLIVDDDEISRTILAEMLQDGYGIFEAENGAQALAVAAAQCNRISVILLDILMPGMDGYEVLRKMKESPVTEDIPIIIITALDSDSSESMGLQSGAIDYITKPFVAQAVKYRVGNQVELKRHRDRLQELVDDKAGKLLRMNETIFDAVTSLIEHRNLESGRHVMRIRIYCRILLENLLLKSEYCMLLNKTSAEIIVRASALHDIGKVAIPDRILLKPAALTPEEFKVMQTHALIGSDFIDSLPDMEDGSYLQYARQICRSHHERWDGNGYPDGLCGNAIPLSARIAAIADVYDALVSKRVYKLPIPHEDAVDIIRNEAERQFDPELVRCFLEVAEGFRAAAQEYSDE